MYALWFKTWPRILCFVTVNLHTLYWLILSIYHVFLCDIFITSSFGGIRWFFFFFLHWHRLIVNVITLWKLQDKKLLDFPFAWTASGRCRIVQYTHQKCRKHSSGIVRAALLNMFSGCSVKPFSLKSGQRISWFFPIPAKSTSVRDPLCKIIWENYEF